MQNNNNNNDDQYNDSKTLQEDDTTQTNKLDTNNRQQQQHARAQVVIVGAGLAGLAAAQRLHEWGLRDVLVLDGQARVGGRVHTVEHAGEILELGAQWLHGAYQNPLYKWLTQLEMLDDFQDASIGFQGLFCSSQGRALDRRLVDRVLDILNETKLLLSKNSGTFCDDISRGGSLSVAQIFRQQLEAKLEHDEELRGHTKQVYAIYEWFLKYENIENGCEDMNDCSIASYTDWTDWGDGTLLNFKQGYKSLLDWFCDRIPAKKWIRLDSRVVSVELSAVDNGQAGGESGGRIHPASPPILVRYHKTSGGSEDVVHTIECNHVIVTASLGFLKKNHETFFSPPLPSVKRELIQSLGFGTVNKIILQFDRPFWQDNKGFKLIWLDDKEEEQQQRQDDLPPWTRDIVAFDIVRRQPKLLIGWIGGEGARAFELESDEYIGQVCLRLIDRFKMNQTTNSEAKLVSCICSRWYSNQFTCGSYSYRAMKSLRLNVDKLHEPIYSDTYSDPIQQQHQHQHQLGSSRVSRVPRVMFAGEATAGRLYSTTNGAVISGWREADRLTDHLMASKRSNSNLMTDTNQLSSTATSATIFV